MGVYQRWEEENKTRFEKYWSDRGVPVKGWIEDTHTKSGIFPSLRSNLRMRIPQFRDGKFTGKTTGHINEIMPRQQRKFLLPVR